MLKIRNRPALLALAGILAAALPSARAQDPAAPARKEKVEIAGALVCAGCHLEKEYGASSQCTLFAKHAQAVLADDGTLRTILDNGRGHLLIADRKLAGTPLRIEAFAFPKTQMIEVIRFKKKQGDAWVQHDYCRSCGFEPGDNGGSDLCADCSK